MKLWITEAIDPSLPHVDYLAARTRIEADDLAGRIGNVRVIGELYTRLQCASPRALMDYIGSRLVVGKIGWRPGAEEQLGSYLTDGGGAASAEDDDD